MSNTHPMYYNRIKSKTSASSKLTIFSCLVLDDRAIFCSLYCRRLLLKIKPYSVYFTVNRFWQAYFCLVGGKKNEKIKKKSWKAAFFFFCRTQFLHVRGLVDCKLYWAWPYQAECFLRVKAASYCKVIFDPFQIGYNTNPISLISVINLIALSA